MNFPKLELELFKSIIFYLKGDMITEQDVWVEAKGYHYYPDMNKILLELISERIIELIYVKMETELTEEDYLKFEASFNIVIEINGLDTFIMIKNDIIDNIEKFIIALEGCK